MWASTHFKTCGSMQCVLCGKVQDLERLQFMVVSNRRLSLLADLAFPSCAEQAHVRSKPKMGWTRATSTITECAPVTSRGRASRWLATASGGDASRGQLYRGKAVRVYIYIYIYIWKGDRFRARQ